MAETKFTVASRALSRLGEPAIASFSGSDVADHVNQLYEPTILGLLSMNPWNFAQKKISLVIDPAAEPAGWGNGFTMPQILIDRVGQPIGFYASAGTNAPRISDYEIQNDWVYTNRSEIFCEYVRREDEADWPGYFLSLAIEALAASFAGPVTESNTKESKHRVIAFGTPGKNGRGGLFEVAQQADSYAVPTQSLLDNVDPIQSVRF